MKVTQYGDTLSVSDIDELANGTVSSFRSELAALPKGVRQIDIDLAHTDFVDCGGLGALVALWKTAGGRNGDIRIRLLNAPAVVRHMWQLLRLDRVFVLDAEAAPAVDGVPSMLFARKQAEAVKAGNLL